MGIGLHRSGSPAQPGWVWGSSARSQGPPTQGGRGGIPGSGRKAGMSQRAPGRSAELGPAVLVGLCRLSSLPGTSLWAGCHERKEGGGRPLPLPWDLPILFETPLCSLSPLPHGPQQPLVVAGGWGGGQCGFWLPALGPCQDAPQGPFDPSH